MGLALAAIAATALPAVTQRKKPAGGGAEADRLGMTCAQILKLSSKDWVAKFTGAKAGDADEAALTIRALGVYGKCYDARTDHLAAELGRAGKGPLMGARGDFGDFQKSLDGLREVALADAQPPGDAVKKAYAALYEKQFRYAFYLSYEPAPRAEASASGTAGSGASTGGEQTAKPAGGKHGAAASPGGKSGATGESSSLKKPEEEEDSEDAGDDTVEAFTKAKNRFGQLLQALPQDKMHEVHEALGKVLGAYEVSQETRENVYLYAIFLLEPAEQEFAPPPF